MPADRSEPETTLIPEPASSSVFCPFASDGKSSPSGTGPCARAQAQLSSAVNNARVACFRRDWIEIIKTARYSWVTKSYLSMATATPCSCPVLSIRKTLPVQRTRIGSARVISGGSVMMNSIAAPTLISVSRYIKTPRELTSRVRPASSRLPVSRNFTEMGKSSENRRVERFSGPGCAMGPSDASTRCGDSSLCGSDFQRKTNAFATQGERRKRWICSHFAKANKAQNPSEPPFFSVPKVFGAVRQSKSQEVFEKQAPGLGQHAFRMELNAFDRVTAMA